MFQIVFIGNFRELQYLKNTQLYYTYLSIANAKIYIVYVLNISV